MQPACLSVLLPSFVGYPLKCPGGCSATAQVAQSLPENLYLIWGSFFLPIRVRESAVTGQIFYKARC